MMNEKILFNFKSNWFEKEIIKNIGIEGFWVYFNIRKFKLQYANNICLFNLDLLHKEIQKYYKTNNRKYSTNNLREIIFNLKKAKVLNFDRKYNIKTNSDLCYVELLDLPVLDKDFKPSTNEDFYITVDTETVDNIFKLNLNENHVVLYYCLKKYVNTQLDGQITLSYQTIGSWLDISKDTANKYAIELEKNKVIANAYTHSQKKHKCNNFVITTNKNFAASEEVNKIAEINNIKRLKKKLQNNNIKVTKAALQEKEYLFQYMTEEEKDMLQEKEECHVVYAIEYLYFNLLELLEERKFSKEKWFEDTIKANKKDRSLKIWDDEELEEEWDLEDILNL